MAATEERVEAYEEVATGVIALVRVGERTEVVTAGKARRRPHVAMEADMRFPLASITKSMTATVIDDPAVGWMSHASSRLMSGRFHWSSL